MTSPAELLEQALAAHGDTLYRLALLVSGDERSAEALLRALTADLMAAWREAPPLAPPGEPELVAGLVAAARAAEAKPTRSRRGGRTVAFGPFAIGRLPLDQRFALGLYVLHAYDGQRIAAALGSEEAAARALLAGAVRALGPAAGHALTDRVSGELCAPVRDALADPGAGPRHGAAVRGHLAVCALCRNFDHAWVEIIQGVEAQLRATLRERGLPPALSTRLIAATRPPRRRISPTLRLALPPLAVLALIAALVLPGFMRTPVNRVERDAGPSMDPQTLVSLALARHSAPPNLGGVWYGRYQTEWYFDEGVYAPLTAEAWLDPRNPARHRLQLTHADGGAPYELQVGNGRDQLYYALDFTYSPAIYGNLPIPSRPEVPALLAERLTPERQHQARDERLAMGPWSIAPSYLRQAQAAPDLRVLGRQRDGTRTVQILSFSGISPLGLPPDAPGATAERVTILLALDSEDGLLRSATELAGPAGAEQTSRVTWRLVEELWLSSGEQIDGAFEIERAWTGLGEFSEVGRHESADLAVPLISRAAVSHPALLIGNVFGSNRIWLPSRVPAGIDRALLLYSASEAGAGNPPRGAIYLGPGRRLVLTFNRSRPVEGEALEAGAYGVTLRPGRTQRYSALLTRPRDTTLHAGMADPSAIVTIDAYGFSRAELLEVVQGMAPFGLESLLAQETLFAGSAADPEATSLLLRTLASGLPSEEQVLFQRVLQYNRQAPAEEGAPQRRDPYAPLLYEGRPEKTMLEEWYRGGAKPVLYSAIVNPVDAERYTQTFIHAAGGWRYVSAREAGFRFGGGGSYIPFIYRLPSFAATALEMLAQFEGEMSVSRLPDGAAVITWREETAGNPRYRWLLSEPESGEPHLYDLQPDTIITEFEVTPDGASAEVRVFAEADNGPRTMVQRYELLERAEVSAAELPAAASEEALPEGGYVVDYTEITDRNAARTLITRTLTEALALAPGELYLPEGLTPMYIEDGPLDQPFAGNGDFLTEAIGRRLAMRFSYRMPALERGGPYVLGIAQGPAEPLDAYLRATGGPPWNSSESARLTVAGREVEVWVGESGEQSYLIAQVEDTLLVVESPHNAFPLQDLALLASLRLAEQP